MEKYYVNPIGRIRVRGEEMWIQLDQKLTAALKALDGFSHLNVLWWFSDSDNEEMRSVLETPQPYKGAPETMGIFATRSPIRPNPIALTAVEVLHIDYEAGVIRIAYIDANDVYLYLTLSPIPPVWTVSRTRLCPDGAATGRQAWRSRGSLTGSWYLIFSMDPGKTG